MSFLSLEAGMSTVSFAAWMPLRMRVRKSAIGSVMALPAGLRHPRDEPLMGELAQADPAQAELAVDRARPAAAAAARVLAGLVLGAACLADALGGLGHRLRSLGGRLGVVGSALAGEGHAERLQQCEGLAVRGGGRHD